MNKKQSLADKITSVLSTTPASFDPDENHEETAAKITVGALEDVDDVDDDLLSNFRRKNIEILEEVDTKYAGKKGNRSSLKDSDDEWETEEESEDEGEAGSDGVRGEDNMETSGDEGSEIESNEGEGSDEEIEREDSESEEGMSVDEDDKDFQHMTEENVPKQMKKGLCVRNQLNVWEKLLEMRIQMQKCLIAANKMPQKDDYKAIVEKSGEEFTNKVNETKNTISNTLNKLLELQSLLWKKYPETKNLLKDAANVKTKKKEEEEMDDDEEIPSDTDAEDSEHLEEETDKDDSGKPLAKRMKLSDFENDLNERHTKYKDYRNSIIQKWNDKTRMGLSKSNLQHSVINQIDHILADKTRLIKRTQTKRSNYEIIGLKDTEQEETEDSKFPLGCNTEIFDDDDFYHQLLRELIEVKSADVTDPVQLGRQWIQLQNLRSKMKRKIDTRATKGRKIRYTVHAKLVNFMAPVDEGTYTEEAKTELFSSLCGKNQFVRKL